MPIGPLTSSSRWRPGSSTSPSTRCSRGPAAALPSRRSPTACALVEAGFDMLDVGAVAARSGPPVPARGRGGGAGAGDRRDWRRRAAVPVSADTFSPEVARQALDAGAVAVNDICGGSRGDVRARRRARLRLRADAHRGAAAGRPALAPTTTTSSTTSSPGSRGESSWRRELGVAEEQIAIDPGLDFDLTPEQDLEILRRLGELRALGLPLYVSLSRKDFIGAVLAGSWEERLAAGRARVGDGRGGGAGGPRGRRRPPHPRPQLTAGDARRGADRKTVASPRGSGGRGRRMKPLGPPACWSTHGRSRSTRPAATGGSSPRAPSRSGAAKPVALPGSLDPGLRRGAAARRHRARSTRTSSRPTRRRARSDLVITSGTASGKSLAFNLPVLDGIAARRRRRRALYLYPTKALAQDQARKLARAAAAGAARGDLRRRHPARGAAGDPPSQQPRPHQPGHAPRRPAAPPQELGRLPRQPRLGRRRRGPHLPRRLRLPRRQRAAAAAPGRPRLRLRAALPARLGDDRQPGRAGRAAGRDGVRADRRRRRAAGRARGGDVEPAADRRGDRGAALGALGGGRPARRAGLAGCADDLLPQKPARDRADPALRPREPGAARQAGAGGADRSLPRRLHAPAAARDRGPAELAASCSRWSPPTRWSWASTSASSTRRSASPSPAPSPACARCGAGRGGAGAGSRSTSPARTRSTSSSAATRRSSSSARSRRRSSTTPTSRSPPGTWSRPPTSCR